MGGQAPGPGWRELENKSASSHAAWVEGILREAVCFTQRNLKALFFSRPCPLHCNIISHLHVSVVLIPLVCANLEIDY